MTISPFSEPHACLLDVYMFELYQRIITHTPNQTYNLQKSYKVNSL